MKKTIDSLDEIVKIQCADGNWNYDPYMMGLANGLIMAQAIIKGTEPTFLSAPKKWLKDYPSLLTRIKWKLFGTPVSSVPEGENVLL
jgi:hypothetical protein